MARSPGCAHEPPTPRNRPAHDHAFMADYGRKLTPTQEQHLTVDAALDALSGIQYGAANGDREVLERGRRTLARLRAEDDR